MGLFDFKKKTVTLYDPVFGELKSRTSVKGGYIYSGTRLFAPVHAEVHCLIAADEGGPSEEQRQFYLRIERNYEDLRKKIIPIISDAFRDAYPEFEINDFDREFNLQCISLPKPDGKSAIWEISFGTVYDENYDFTLIVNDLEPEDEVIING